MLFAFLFREIFRQVHNRQQDLPRFKDPLHSVVGMRDRFYLIRHHDLPNLCHIDAIQFVIDCELHDLNLICP